MTTQSSYPEWQLYLTNGVSETVSALSFLGSLFILTVYLRYPPLRKWSFTLVACLALTDVFNQFFDFLSPSPSDINAMLAGAPTTAQCWVQAIGNGIFELASVFWTGSIAFTLYRLVWLRDRLEAVERQLPAMLLFIFGVPTVLTLLPFLQGSHVYGPSGGHSTWCWIRPAYPHWVFVCFYIPLWCTMLFNAFVYTRTNIRLRGIQSHGSELDAATAARFRLILERLNWYPAILLIVWGPASVNRVLEAATGGQGSFFLLYFLQRVFSSSQGLLNACAYGLTRGVREAVAKDLRPYLPRGWCAGAQTGEEGIIAEGEGEREREGGRAGSVAAALAAPAATAAAAAAAAAAPTPAGASGLLASEARQAVDVRTIQEAQVEEEEERVQGAPPRNHG